MWHWTPYTTPADIDPLRPVLLCIGGDTITMAMRNESGQLRHAIDSDGFVHEDFADAEISEIWSGGPITHWCYAEFPKGA